MFPENIPLKTDFILSKKYAREVSYTRKLLWKGKGDACFGTLHKNTQLALQSTETNLQIDTKISVDALHIVFVNAFLLRVQCTIYSDFCKNAASLSVRVTAF